MSDKLAFQLNIQISEKSRFFSILDKKKTIFLSAARLCS